jgi:hypothetical protein
LDGKLADPCKTRDNVLSNDPEHERDGEVLRQWCLWYGDRTLTVGKICADLDGEWADPDQQPQHDEEVKSLKQAILAVASERDNSNKVSAWRFGNWCSRVQSKVIGGLRLVKSGTTQHARTWTVTEVVSKP